MYCSNCKKTIGNAAFLFRGSLLCKPCLFIKFSQLQKVPSHILAFGNKECDVLELCNSKKVSKKKLNFNEMIFDGAVYYGTSIPCSLFRNW